jgi:hypothetical protein
MFGVGQSMGQARDEVHTLTQRATIRSKRVQLSLFPLWFLSSLIYSRVVVSDGNCLYLNIFLSSVDQNKLCGGDTKSAFIPGPYSMVAKDDF